MRQERKSSIRMVPRSRARRARREERERASKRQVKHQPILPRPVYTMLRSQASQGCPRVSRHVPPLVLEEVTGMGGNVSTMVRGIGQSNLFAGTSAWRTRERGYGHQ